MPPQVTPDSENDFGNYNCTAVNRIGQESSEFILVQAGEQAGQAGCSSDRGTLLCCSVLLGCQESNLSLQRGCSWISCWLCISVPLFFSVLPWSEL